MFHCSSVHLEPCASCSRRQWAPAARVLNVRGALTDCISSGELGWGVASWLRCLRHATGLYLWLSMLILMASYAHRTAGPTRPSPLTFLIGLN